MPSTTPTPPQQRNWGTAYILYALFQFIVFCAGFYAVGIAFGGTFAAQSNDDLTGYTIAAVLGLVALISSPLLLILAAICGFGMRSERRWSRVLGIVTAVLSLILFPIGTLFGALALRYFFSPTTKSYYASLQNPS